MLRIQPGSRPRSSAARRARRTIFVVSAGLACSALPATARAQALDDRFWVEGSFFWPAVDTEIRIDNLATANPGTDIDIESDLDLDDRDSLPAFLAGARLGGGFSIVGEYFAVGRSGSTTLQRDITIDDVTYPATATIESGFDSDVYRLSVGWAFARGPDYEFGGSLGVHATDFEFSLSGTGSVNGGTASTQVRRRDVLAPLPTLGLFGSYQVAPGLTLGGRVDFMSLGIDDYDGRMLNLQANLVYRFADNFGVGIGYRHVDYRVDVEKNDWVGRADYKFSGPNIFVQIGFR
jgi:hypothetical protein